MTASEIARLLEREPAMTREGWYNVRGVCHDGDRRIGGGSLGIRDRDDGALGFHCFVGCDFRAIKRALESETGLPLVSDAGESSPVAPPRAGGPSQTVPIADSHPAPVHAWLRRRRIWTRSATIPASLRWLPMDGENGGAAGAIVYPFAPLDEWLLAWPALPNPVGVQLIYLSAIGLPVRDRGEEAGGLFKRSRGSLAGAVCALGDPMPVKGAGVALCEGLADALAALNTLDVSAALVLGGTSGAIGLSRNPDAISLLARYDALILCPDKDEAGQSAFGQLAAAIWSQERRAVMRFRSSPYKDIAEWASALARRDERDEHYERDERQRPRIRVDAISVGAAL